MYLRQDLRFAVRMLRKTPALTAVAVLALGLGIGANTAIFSLVDTALLQPLPFPHPEQLVQVEKQFQGGTGTSTSVPNFLDWRSQGTTFAHMSAYEQGFFNLSGRSTSPERVPGMYVDTDFFQLLGVNLRSGGFQPSDDQAGRPPVAVISNRLWQARFGGDPGILGRAVQINDQQVPIVGILPTGFTLAGQTDDVFEPLQPEGLSQDRTANFISVIGRIRSGVTLGAARAQMLAVSQRMGQRYPEDHDFTIELTPLQQVLSGNLKPALLMLMGAAGLVLLIACIDLANLLLAKAAGRRQEIAMRMALGAPARRIVGQLLTESVLLAVGGGVVGLGLGWAGLRAVTQLAPTDVASFELARQAGMNATVLLFTLALATLTGVLFGWAPAARVARTDINAVLQQGAAGSGGRHRLSKLLIVGELGLALPLLIGAGLLTSSLVRLRDVNGGFKVDHLLTAHLPLATGRYKTPADLGQLETQLLPQVRALPGVQAAALTICLPGQCGPDMPFEIVGRNIAAKDMPDALYLPTSTQTFAALGTPVIEGRGLLDSDTQTSAPVVIINQTVEKQWWPHQDPVGQSIWIGKGVMGTPQFIDAAPRTIVGVVGDVHENLLQTPAPPSMYLPLTQILPGMVPLLDQLEPLALLVRTAGPPVDAARAAEQAVWNVDADQPVSDVKSMQEVESGYFAQQRFNLVLLGVFAGLALVLAAIGVYGVLAHATSQRGHEIGLRMTLGATPQSVTGLILGDGLKLALAGVVIGLGVAAALGRYIASMLYGVKSWDPAMFALAAGCLLLVACLACWLPARRAARLDPWKALREER